MAGAAGFEPANAGIKSRCLTAWRRPIGEAPDLSQSRASGNINPQRRGIIPPVAAAAYSAGWPSTAVPEARVAIITPI